MSFIKKKSFEKGKASCKIRSLYSASLTSTEEKAPPKRNAFHWKEQPPLKMIGLEWLFLNSIFYLLIYLILCLQ